MNVSDQELITTFSQCEQVINSNFKVHQLDKNGISDWNDYVNSQPNATFFHRAEWKWIIESAFKHKSYLLGSNEIGIPLTL